MNKQTISIPEGIFYLTDVPSLSGKLPDCSYILNKVMTGCGATTFFLLDNKEQYSVSHVENWRFVKPTRLYLKVKSTCLVLAHMRRRKMQAQSLTR